MTDVRVAADRVPGPAAPTVRTRARTHLVVLAAGLVLLAAVAALSIGVGSGDVGFTAAWRLLWHPDGGYDSAVVHTVRLPRTILGLAAGAALAVAGALMQALTRNPLADPGVFGVNAGASASIAVAITTLGVSSFAGYVWFGFLGAALASAMTFFIGARSGADASPVRLALAGMAVNAALTAFTNGFVYIDSTAFNQYRSWVIGSLDVKNMTAVWQGSIFIVVGLLVALVLARHLDALSLGDDTGTALGAKAGRTRVVGMVAVTLLCGAATAVAGPIAFVGLAVPHLVRAATGPNHRWLLPYCVVFSPVLLLGADVLGRVIGPGGELEVSIMTAVLGGPVFVWIARRKRLAEL